MINKYDIIVICVIMVITIIIVVINIKKMLNDKLTNVEIKIPEIEIPKSDIVVKIQRECNSDKFDVHVEKDNLKTPAQKIGLSPSANFIKNIKTIEDFDNTAMKNDQYIEHFKNENGLFKKSELFKYDPTKDVFSETELSEEEKKFLKYKNDLQRIQKDTILFRGLTLPKNVQNVVSEEERGIEIIPQYKTMFPSTDKNIEFPDDDQIIDYDRYNCSQYSPSQNKNKIVDHGNYVCMTKSHFNQLNNFFDPTQIKKHNTEVVQNIIKNDKKYDESDMEKMNPVDDANRKWDKDDHYDYMEYFLKHRQFIPSSFEDGVTRGGNIGEYTETAGLDDIGKIKLGKTKYRFPRPNNYIFTNM